MLKVIKLVSPRPRIKSSSLVSESKFLTARLYCSAGMLPLWSVLCETVQPPFYWLHRLTHSGKPFPKHGSVQWVASQQCDFPTFLTLIGSVAHKELLVVIVNYFKSHFSSPVCCRRVKSYNRGDPKHLTWGLPNSLTNQLLASLSSKYFSSV
jgi:hypothetical protein